MTAVEILGMSGCAPPLLAPPVKAKAENFTVKEVSANAAYCGAANLETIQSVGATPYIAFKENTTGGIGGVFAKAFHYYNAFRDDFLAHYHKRSNVESAFSMMKAKFGDSLRSKTDVAMVNEALCKILCHNLCCLIQSIYELGINATFWAKDEVPAATSLGTEYEVMEAWAWV